MRARWLAKNAVARGKLVPQPCERCGSEKHVEKHHEDYARPLDVRWLCRGCHKAEHTEGDGR